MRRPTVAIAFEVRYKCVGVCQTCANLPTCRSGLYHLEIRVKIGYALIGMTYIATEISILLGCQPFTHNWQIYPDPGSKLSADFPS